MAAVMGAMTVAAAMLVVFAVVVAEGTTGVACSFTLAAGRFEVWLRVVVDGTVHLETSVIGFVSTVGAALVHEVEIILWSLPRHLSSRSSLLVFRDELLSGLSTVTTGTVDLLAQSGLPLVTSCVSTLSITTLPKPQRKVLVASRWRRRELDLTRKAYVRRFV